MRVFLLLRSLLMRDSTVMKKNSTRVHTQSLGIMLHFQTKIYSYTSLTIVVFSQIFGKTTTMHDTIKVGHKTSLKYWLVNQDAILLLLKTKLKQYIDSIIVRKAQRETKYAECCCKNPRRVSHIMNSIVEKFLELKYSVIGKFAFFAFCIYTNRV